MGGLRELAAASAIESGRGGQAHWSWRPQGRSGQIRAGRLVGAGDMATSELAGAGEDGGGEGKRAAAAGARVRRKQGGGRWQGEGIRVGKP